MRCPLCALPALLFLASPATAQPREKPQPSPEAARAYELAAFTPTFESYVFTGDKFPAPGPRPKGLRPEESFLDRDYQTVEKARTPGPYIAVVELGPQEGKGPVSRRFVTLFRAAEASDDVARAARVSPVLVERNQALVDRVIRKRPFAEWSKDPQAARLLAGLATSTAVKGPARPYDDAVAAERQWLVGFKRRFNGWDKQFARPVQAPTEVVGTPAPEVHEGNWAEAGMKPDAARKIDAACREWAQMSDQAFAVCVVRNGVIVLHQAYGTRDGKPMTTETKSWMASITKTMSATLMMILVDQGYVSLDDEVSKYMPRLRDIPVKKPLLVRHLYTHTGGLAEGPQGSDDVPDMGERLADQYPVLRVGESWAYTGRGNVIGGKIIEAVSGEAIPQFYQKHLLGPLGCEHTDVTGTHADAWSIPLDMAKFGQLLLNKGAYGPYRFFSEDTFEKMLPRRLTAELGPGAKKTFGIGLDGRPEKFGHGAASAATFSVDMDRKLVVVICRNKEGTNYGKGNSLFWNAIDAGIPK